MIIGVDHVLVAIDDMDAAAKAYRRLGFEVQPGGEHPRMGTFNSLVPVADGAYIELIGVKDRGLADKFPNSRLVVRALGRENRIATFALVSNNLKQDIETLRARGLEIGDPIDGERMRPDGQKVAWRSAHFEDPNLPFLIEDITPHHVRVPVPSQGIGQRAFLALLEILAVSVPDASRVWKDLLGKIPDRDDQFLLERTTIRLESNNGRPTGLDGVSIGVDDLEGAAKTLQQAGVLINRSRGALALDRSASAGARLSFVQAL